MLNVATTLEKDFDLREEPPLASVCLITFNHAPYIRECLDSLLGQKTSFPYEICIGEDESSDGTRAICAEYAEKYPGKIRLILRSQSEPERRNFLSQGVYNYIETTKACRGKYVAQCDGDDVWLDPLKLQKQIDVMEADSGVALVCSNYELWNEVSNRRVNRQHKCHDYFLDETLNTALFRRDLVCMQYQIAASSTVMRTKDVLEIFDTNQDLFRSLPMGDTPTWCELMDYGTIRFIDEPMIARRYLPESDSSSRSAEKKFKFVNLASNYGLLVGEKYNLPMDVVRSVKIKNSNRYALLSGEFSEIETLYSNPRFRFSLRERMLYQFARLPLIRTVLRGLFQLRYNINNWRFAGHFPSVRLSSGC